MELKKNYSWKDITECWKKIEPSAIICYSEPFPEMRGNIIYIDYELSSWKHLSDEKSFENVCAKMI